MCYIFSEKYIPSFLRGCHVAKWANEEVVCACGYCCAWIFCLEQPNLAAVWCVWLCCPALGQGTPSWQARFSEKQPIKAAARSSQPPPASPIRNGWLCRCSEDADPPGWRRPTTGAPQFGTSPLQCSGNPALLGSGPRMRKTRWKHQW